MIEIQCTSCHTRYRIDEGLLPDDTPTFKCSRCGHVFNAAPAAAKPKKPAPVRIARKSAPQPEPEPSVAPEIDPPQARNPEPEDERAHAQPPAPIEAPVSKPSTEELMNKPFQHSTDKVDSGENLTFDFSDDEPDGGARDDEEISPGARDDQWQVGDAADEPAQKHEPDMRIASAPAMAPERPRIAIVEPRQAEPRPAEMPPPQFSIPPALSNIVQAERSPMPDGAGWDVERGPTHSAGWFLAMFFFVAVGFGVLSMTICSEPAASTRLLSEIPGESTRFARPIVPATLVALHGVHAEYRKLKGGEAALVVSGTAQNVGDTPLHAILLAVDLLDGSQKALAGRAAFIGNGLSDRMIGEMTPREIDFLQHLDPPRGFELESNREAPFLMVFIGPPARISNLRISVAKAAPTADSAAPHA